MPTEQERLEEDRLKQRHWRKWGPYLTERQWATVREDYSDDGDVWGSFPHEEARSRVYLWGEDGIAGISDNHQHLCFAFAFWNGEDPILKERLFGLTGKEGNHGEDVKEYYYHLDNTPTHSYMKYLYKYPHSAYPYQKLVTENQKRSLFDMEYELLDTGIFQENAYFDIFIEYAKVAPEDILIQATIFNRGEKPRSLHLLPKLWFRNTWHQNLQGDKPQLNGKKGEIEAKHSQIGEYHLYCEAEDPLLLFTENEPHRKSAFHRYLIQQDPSSLNPEPQGTQGAFYTTLEIPAKASKTLRLRLSKSPLETPFQEFDPLFEEKRKEADTFYQQLQPPHLTEELKQIQRQAFAGLLWNKQFYHYIVEEWQQNRKNTLRNEDWTHLYNDDILSVPDKWEYPCFFSWDSAFHAVPFSLIDPEFAKKQLSLFTREWYMHPNGQLPAYEWSFNDVNPPVHAWAAWRVYKIEQKTTGRTDLVFLESLFQKMLLNFTWWVNRKDKEGKNIFQGGFLGLDNISVFNRSEDIPDGSVLYQSDATSWMGMYCLNMCTIALELAKENPTYEEMASKFYKHFLYIADAINISEKEGDSLWDEEDGFYYDLLKMPSGEKIPLKVRSMVGVIPLFAVATLDLEALQQFPSFKQRMEWFLNNRKELCSKVACMRSPGQEGRRLLSIVHKDKLRRVLAKLLDENEFLSPHGIRSLSKYHQEHPYTLRLNSHEYKVSYEPAESTLKLFGGNSNWRGPIWFPLNILIIESLQKYHHYFGEEFKVEFPTGSGHSMNLWEVSHQLSQRLLSLFLKDANGERPLYGGNPTFQQDPHWNDKILFYEYFHGENGAGMGASHQAGWTALIAKLIQQHP